MSPVRGKGWYKKPYKVRWLDTRSQKRRSKAFHWSGPAEDEYAWLLHAPWATDVTLSKEGPTVDRSAGLI